MVEKVIVATDAAGAVQRHTFTAHRVTLTQPRDGVSVLKLYDNLDICYVVHCFTGVVWTSWYRDQGAEPMI